MTLAAAPVSRLRGGRRRASTPQGVLSLNRASGLGLGLAVLWMSLLVFLPISAVLIKASSSGWSGFWQSITSPGVSAALKLTIVSAFIVTAVNAVMGTLVAWVLVRDRFFGHRVLSVVIDVPFALPTIVAGLVLISLYGPRSPIGLDLAATRAAILIALLFVTLPFVVRAVQPVLEELDADVEEAAASLGANRLTTFRRIILPNIAPAIAAGSALCFARALGEYGSVVLISSNLPGKTEVASSRMLSQIENDNLAAAAATATVLLLVALLVIVGLEFIQRRTARRD